MGFYVCPFRNSPLRDLTDFVQTPDNGGIYLGQRIKFEAVVTFPPAILDHPLHTDLLRTSMSNWRIEVDDIKDHISFGSVMFSTTNGAIHVGVSLSIILQFSSHLAVYPANVHEVCQYENHQW